MSCAIQIFGTVTQPVASSTSASTTHAVYEYAGDGPTPAPLYLPGDFGGAYEPTAPSVPKRASAQVTASANESPAPGSSAGKTRPSANTSSPVSPSFARTA